MKTDWNGLEEVIAVADAGSFAGAARRMNLSTSHISRAVADMEQRLDVKLFLRTTRRTRVTESGKQFVQLVRPLIEQRNAALAQIQKGSEPRGELRVTCSTMIGERFVAPLSLKFVSDFPNVSFFLDLSNRVVDLIEEGYDLGIRTGPVEDERMWKTSIGERKFHLCASREYVDKYGRPETVKSLKDHICLIGNSETWKFVRNNQATTFSPESPWKCSSSKAVLDACLAGFGICNLPALYVIDYLEQGELVRLLPEYERASEPIWAVCPKQIRFEPTIVAFIEQLKEDDQINAYFKI